jgi:hypothetical protein
VIEMPMPKQLVGKAVPINQQPNQRKGAGRKPKVVKKWLKDSNIPKKQAQNILLHLLQDYTLTGLQELNKSEVDRVSVLTYGLIRQVIAATVKNDFSIMKQMLEFIYGKDEQPIKINDDTRIVDLKMLLIKRCEESPDEMERIIDGLEKAAGDSE